MTTSDKKKFVWDEKMTELYIKICVQEVRVGNRPSTHLNKKGWTNLQEKFILISQKTLDTKQLKNKWDNLKKDWQIWKKLLGKETGLGWNAEKRTIDASDAWWESKMKEVPAAAKFRENGLLLQEEMELLFGEVVATGQQAWAPSSGTLPETQFVHPLLEGSGDSDDSPPLREAENLHVEGSTTMDKGKGKRLSSSSSSSKAKKRSSRTLSVQQSLDRLSTVVESVSKKTNSGIEECVDILESLNIKDDQTFYYQSLFWLGKEKDMRKMFLCLKTPETQVGFLRMLVEQMRK